MATVYPNSIDGYSEIREVADRNSNYKIDARDHNDLRSAIVAIETTLGINPQGTFGSVADRLDDGYAMISLHAAGSIPRHSDEDVDASEKTGAIKVISAGTINTQVQTVLDYVNEIHASGGAGLVGATGFISSEDNFVVSETTVQGQIEEVVDFMDNEIGFLKKAFNSYVVEGFEVTVKSFSEENGLVVDISSGYIAVQGMFLHYSGEVDKQFFVGTETVYLYAYRELGVVYVGLATELNISSTISNVETICVLAEITISTEFECSNIDMRRFGVFSNDKNCFTVGEKPVDGYDGYGCDFISLKSAVKYVSLMQEGGVILGQNKISLVSNITIDAEGEAEIELPRNTEIDGSGNIIFYSAAASLFVVDEDNITIRNLNVVTDFDSEETNGEFIFAAKTQNISNLKVLDCKISGDGTFDINYFISLGENQVIDGFVMRNNNLAIGGKGINYSFIEGFSIDSIKNAIIEGNQIYQTDVFSPSGTTNGIMVGSYSKVINNVIRGGYSVGIEVIEGSFTDVQGNTIEGSFLMDSGIAVSSVSSINSNHIISGNNISGVVNCGIDCKAGSGYSKTISVNGNIIDNVNLSGSSSLSMMAINGSYLMEVSVLNNIILSPGAETGVNVINEATQVIGNYIVCMDGYFGNNDSVIIYVKKPGSIVSKNVIKNSTGVCIFIEEDSHSTSISNNLIIDTFSSTANCITVIESDYVSIINNSILGNELEVRERSGIYLEACNKGFVCGNSISNLEGTAIAAVGLCYGNNILDNLISNVLIGIDCGAEGSEYVIKDNFIIYDDSIVILTENGIVGIGNNSCVDGNYIYGVGQDENNYAILCIGTENISVVNNIIIGVDGKELIGIDCSSSQKNKISGNYLLETFVSIYCAAYDEVSFNKILSYKDKGIVVSGEQSNIFGNQILGDDLGVVYGLLNYYDGVKISNNYFYVNGNRPCCISLVSAEDCLVEGNYLQGVGAISGSMYCSLILVQGCQNISICSNYIINEVTGNYPIGIYSLNNEFISIVSNYISGVNQSSFYNIYSNNSKDSVISNNYLYFSGSRAIYAVATTTAEGKGYLISGNYIFTGAPAFLVKAIEISDAQVNMVNICGNFIQVDSTVSNSNGINIGDTTDRHILLSSNMVKMVTGTTSYAVVVSNDAAIKAMGNVALGGLYPGSLWHNGYENYAGDNVFRS